MRGREFPASFFVSREDAKNAKLDTVPLEVNRHPGEGRTGYRPSPVWRGYLDHL